MKFFQLKRIYHYFCRIIVKGLTKFVVFYRNEFKMESKMNKKNIFDMEYHRKKALIKKLKQKLENQRDTLNELAEKEYQERGSLSNLAVNEEVAKFNEINNQLQQIQQDKPSSKNDDI